MTHIPRKRPRLWPLVLGFITVLLLLAFTAVSVITDPPLPPPQVSYLGHDKANPWGAK